jgi:hypothetical protein
VFSPNFPFGTFALVIHHGTRLELEGALPFFSVGFASVAGSFRLVHVSLSSLEESLDTIWSGKLLMVAGCSDVWRLQSDKVWRHADESRRVQRIDTSLWEQSFLLRWRNTGVPSRSSVHSVSTVTWGLEPPPLCQPETISSIEIFPFRERIFDFVRDGVPPDCVSEHLASSWLRIP